MYTFLWDVFLYLLFVINLMPYCKGQWDDISSYYNVKEMKDTLTMTSKASFFKWTSNWFKSTIFIF